MIFRAFLISVVVCFLSLTSLPAFSLTPYPIGWDKFVSTANIIVRVTPGNNGQARYWWWKANIEGTIHCGKYDMSQVLYQPVTGDTWLSAYLLTNMFPSVPMSEADKAWCLQ